MSDDNTVPAGRDIYQWFLEALQQQAEPQEDTTPYVLVSVPIDGMPKAVSVVGKKKLAKAVRAAYKKNDQQYLYVIRGVRGEMVLCNNALHLSFEHGTEETDEVQIKLSKKPKLVQNGWIGDE